MKKSNFALRLMPSLIRELREIAREEGVSINQLINVAVAEKLAQIAGAREFLERRSKGRPRDVKRALRILRSFGDESVDEAQALAEMESK